MRTEKERDPLEETAPRTSTPRTTFLLGAGIVALVGGVGLAVQPGFSPLDGLGAATGFVGYVLLVGSPLEGRFRFDARWRKEPGRPARDEAPNSLGRDDAERVTSGTLLKVATLIVNLTLCARTPATVAAEVAGSQVEATPAAAPAEEKKGEPPKAEAGLFDGVKLSGFVDVYASFDANRPSTRDGFLPGTGSTAKKANQLGVNLVAFEAVKEPAPLGFRVVLNWGTATDLIHSGEPTGTAVGPEVWKVVQYATIAWKVPGSEVLLEGGVFPCHVGAEAYFSKDNPHYTRSFVAEYSPWYSAGVKATAPIGKGFTGQLHVLNGWQIVGENNDGKTLGAGLGWTSSAVDVSLNGLAGPEIPNDTAHWRSFGDLVVTWRPTPSVTVTGELDTGSQSRPGLDAATWWGAFVSARAALNDRNAVALRAERFSDPDAGITGFQQKLWGVTGTFEHRPHPRLILKVDVRYDESTEPLFDGSVAGEGETSQFLAVLGAVATL